MATLFRWQFDTTGLSNDDQCVCTFETLAQFVESPVSVRLVERNQIVSFYIRVELKIHLRNINSELTVIDEKWER